MELWLGRWERERWPTSLPHKMSDNDTIVKGSGTKHML
jgi:hypothetical protein